METAAITLPVTMVTAGLLGLLAIGLSINVVRHRVRAGLSLDRAGDPALHVAVRVFGNFTEYVPLALVLLAVAEINRQPAAILWTVAGLLIAGRLCHMFGLSIEKPVNVRRMAGMLLTWVSLGLASAMLLYSALG